MPTWNEFMWAVFYFGVMSKDITGNSDYLQLMRQHEFLQALGTNPNQLQAEEVQQKVITGFLNCWKCRISNPPEAANAVLETLQNLAPYLQALQDQEIEGVQLDALLNIDGNQTEISRIIEHCYDEIRKIGHRFGPTATSKLLHILQPRLFVMCDGPILSHYHQIDARISNRGQGYCRFLQTMQDVTAHIREELQNPTNYLNEVMEYHPPKTMAKYLDEYNWVTITHGVQIPPHWHPCDYFHR